MLDVRDRLSAVINAVAPATAFAIGRLGNSETVQLRFSAATPEQQAAAQAVLAAFDWSDAAHSAWLADQQPERKTLKESAAQAVADNLTFIADAAVTQAEAVAQVKALTRQVNRIIALLAKD